MNGDFQQSQTSSPAPSAEHPAQSLSSRKRTLSILLGAFYALTVLSLALAVGLFLRDAARSYAFASASQSIAVQAAARGAETLDPEVAVARGESAGEVTAVEPAGHDLSAAPPAQSKLNILLLGTDERPDEPGPARTDTMMLFSLDLETKTVGMISLPRDLWVPIPGYDIATKINTAYVIGERRGYPGGGAQLAKDTVSSFIGRPVEYYLRVNFNGFVRFIDLIGGVDIYVPKTIHDDLYPTENYGYQTFHLEAGQQHLDGETALKYVRTRHADSDYVRAQRQQQVIRAVMEQVLAADMLPTLIAKTPQLMATMRDSVDTDLPVSVAVDMASYVRHNALRDVRQLVLDNRFGSEGYSDDGAWILMPDRSLIRPALGQFFASSVMSDETHVTTNPLPQTGGNAGRATGPNPTVTDPAALRLEILNGTETPGVAARVRDALAAEGWQVVAIGDADRTDYRRTLIVNYNADEALVAQISRDLQIAPNLPRLAGLHDTHAIDLRIVVGQDFVKDVLDLNN